MTSCLQTEPIDSTRLVRFVHSEAMGAVVVFRGTVRNHHGGREVVGLAYSAYPAMVESVVARLIGGACERWPVRATVAHRIGEIPLGEDAVVVAVASAHRGPAFEACAWLIERIKAEVPIWKRERYADGSEAWVDPGAAAAPIGGPVP